MTDKPIDQMTVAERDAEIVRMAWPTCSVVCADVVTESGDIQSPVPSRSLDTCIAAMEAGGLTPGEITNALIHMGVNYADIGGTKRLFARSTLIRLRAAQEPRHV